MRFGNPEALLALGLLPVVALLLWLMAARRRALLARYAEHPMLAHLMPGYSRVRAAMRPVFLLAAVALAVVAAARPQWGYEDRRIRSRGVDLIVAVDTSLSMLAQDYRPSRLARAKELLQNILWTAKGDRLGVVAFAGDAVVMSPLTLDHRMASMALDSINPGTVGVQGTSLHAAVDAAVRAFEEAGKGERVLVLLTDGESHDGKLAQAIDKATQAGMRVHTIGIGTSEGMPIPMTDGRYKEDRGGAVVSTKLDFLSLTRLSEATGGKAIRANPTGTAELVPIREEIDALQAQEQQEMTMRVYTERFQWFLVPALVLLVLEMLETGASRRAGAGRRWSRRAEA